MQIQYRYGGETFTSLYHLRQKLWEKEGVIVRVPVESNAEFWKGFGVEYSEEPESLEAVRAAKLAELERAFLNWYEKEATVTTSFGFVADSDARAMMDVAGLVTALEAQPEETRTTVNFMDAENQVHALTLDQVKQVQLEIIQNGQSAYQQKWAYRTAIESAATVKELDGIEIVFEKPVFC